MFLAWKEIKHDKLRYGLITMMIVLIGYLVFILTSLSIGLANQNTQAINSWKPNTIILNKNSNINIGQSKLTTTQVENMHLDNKKSSLIGNSAVVATSNKKSKISSQFVGIKKNQYIYKNLKLSDGQLPKNNREVVADSQFQEKGYRIGDQIKLNDANFLYKIVGFTKQAKLNIAPVLYGDLNDWHRLSNLDDTFAGNAVISKQKIKLNDANLFNYPVNKVIQNLPGYSAQNMTFSFMIGFLLIISLIVIAVFLYILTMQKVNNYSVLRAQGIPANFLMKSTLIQSIILVGMGIIGSLLITILTLMLLPSSVPIDFNLPIIGGTIIGLLLTGIIGAIIPAFMIVRIDPAEAIGG